ncbi:MAG: GGDEF domain-containing protein [Burkholderiales bacterium]|nr:GGDEF domain-containing protein [Burkholderiales bacterium]
MSPPRVEPPLSAAWPTTPPRRRWPMLLGEHPSTRRQAAAVLFSFTTYLLYGLIFAIQVWLGVVAPAVGVAIVASGLVFNGLCYALVRSGIAREGLDPGLAHTQLTVGVLFMLAAYAASGPAASGVLIVMASHIVYAMFTLPPRVVWALVGGSLTGLALTMVGCGLLWPERFRTDTQLVAFLYAALVVPLIAMLSDRLTTLTQRLKTQHAALEQALAKVQELATRDELTRAHNRAHMQALLDNQHAQHRRMQAPMTVAMIDLDHFKRINDRHGHATGDEVLRRFATLARAELRSIDQLARWGGEEFLVLLPNTAADDGLRALDRLQRKLADGRLAGMPEGLVVTFSGGVAQVAGDEPVEAAVARADAAMYRAKHNGRGHSLCA